MQKYIRSSHKLSYSNRHLSVTAICRLQHTADFPLGLNYLPSDSVKILCLYSHTDPVPGTIDML